MPEPFAFDSIGFLQLLNQLERRFDEVVSHAPLSFDRIDSPTIQPHTSTESSNRRTGAFHRRGSAAKGRNATPERAENEQMCQTVSAQVQAQMDLFSRVDRRIDVLAQDLFGPTHGIARIGSRPHRRGPQIHAVLFVHRAQAWHGGVVVRHHERCLDGSAAA